MARQQLSPVVEAEEPTLTSIDPEPAAEREIYRATPSRLYMRSASSTDLEEPVWGTAADTPATAPSSVAMEPQSGGVFALGEDGLPLMVPPPRG
jgi:hypothetical protein